MAGFISVRDIDFHASTTGVRVQVTTDVPAHLYARVTSEPPRIHKKTAIIRGLRLQDDVRFCFTVFVDHEQVEAGDTLTHTWWEIDWPVCTTKHLYLWGEIGAVVSVSTSPVFSYHNDGLSPVPPPEKMYQFNAIDPEKHILGGGSSYNYESFEYDVHEDATGVILCLHQIASGADNRLAIRKAGASYDNYFPFQRSGVQWLIVGLDDQKRIQYRSQTAGVFDCWVMGYTGRNVVFPDDPIDIKPTSDDTYRTFNIHDTWPEAQLIFTDQGSNQAWNTNLSIRPSGSSKDIRNGSFHTFPFCAVPANGQIQTKLYRYAGVSTKWSAYAYVKEDSTFSLNGIDMTTPPLSGWNTHTAAPLNVDARWVFVELAPAIASGLVQIRKLYSFFNRNGRNNNHVWMISHLHNDHEFQTYVNVSTTIARLLAEVH